MKKLMAFVLILVCAFVLIGCSQAKYKLEVVIDGNEKDDELIDSLNLRDSYAAGSDVNLKLPHSEEYCYYLYLNGEWLAPNDSDPNSNFMNFSFKMPSEDVLIQITKTSIWVPSLKEKYPEYFNVYSSLKGIEVYLWEGEGGNYYCGILPGTNRNKTNEEIAKLAANGATIAEMKEILSTYDINESEIPIIPIKNPSSSYEIDNTLIFKVKELFWGKVSDCIIEENGEKYLVLPISKTKISIQGHSDRINRIDIMLLRAADKRWINFKSSREDAPLPSLQLDNSYKLCLHAETIVEIDPPNTKTLENGTVLTSGCDIDHRHVFFTATIQK